MHVKGGLGLNYIHYKAMYKTNTHFIGNCFGRGNGDWSFESEMDRSTEARSSLPCHSIQGLLSRHPLNCKTTGLL